MTYQPTGRPPGRPPSPKIEQAAAMLSQGTSARQIMLTLKADWRVIVKAKALVAAQQERTPTNG